MNSKTLLNFNQQARAIVGLKPIGCSSAKCYCLPGHIFKCTTCKNLVPWCKGASDGMPDSCDDCWVVAQQMQEAAGIEGEVGVAP